MHIIYNTNLIKELSKREPNKGIIVEDSIQQRHRKYNTKMVNERGFKINYSVKNCKVWSE